MGANTRIATQTRWAAHVALVFAVGLVALLVSDSARGKSALENLKRLGLLTLVAVGALWAYYAQTGETPRLVQRMLAFHEGSQYYDSSGGSYLRLTLFAEALRGWSERPLLGQGVGGFSVVWNNSDERLFPHNLFFELLCELGLVGLLLFLLAPYAATTLSRDHFRRTPVGARAMALALPLSALANTMTSGDLPDNRFLVFAIGLLAFRDPRVRPPRARPRPSPAAAGLSARVEGAFPRRPPTPVHL